jgi:hypothetical protein
VLRLHWRDGASFTLERRLFHELHNHRVTSPDIKEFKESYSFVNAVRKLFGTKKDSFDLILDVAGGHGALGALFLAVGAAQQAVVIDPADVGGGAVRRAWHVFLQGKLLRYRHELFAGRAGKGDRNLGHLSPTDPCCGLPCMSTFKRPNCGDILPARRPCRCHALLPT